MKIFLGMLVCVLSVHTAFAYDWAVSGDVENFSAEINNILPGVELTGVSPGNTIMVTNPTYIENYGTIHGNLVATDDNHIHINNVGNIDGIIDASYVVQYVSCDEGAQHLDVHSDNFSVIVQDAHDGVQLTRLKNLMPGPITISNSMIIVDDFNDWQMWTADISFLDGSYNTMMINNVQSIDPNVYVRYISNEHIINFLTSDQEKLYRIDFITDAYGKKLSISRETNYYKIFADGRGEFLDNIRIKKPDDKMLMMMDSATSIEDLNNIMNSSYRFNPRLMLRPITSVNHFSFMDGLLDNEMFGVGVEPMYIVGENTHAFGALFYGNTNYSDYDFKLGFRLNKFEYKDRFNDFGGLLYGANARVKRKIDKFSVAGHLGADLIKFDADNIYSNSGAIDNPSGSMIYGGIDGLYNYNVFDDLFVSPFISVNFQHFSVIDFDENDTNIYGGGMIKYGFTMDGVKYEYGALCGVVANGDMFADFKIGFQSLVDNAGVSVKFGGYKDERATSYRTSIVANVSF